MRELLETDLYGQVQRSSRFSALNPNDQVKCQSRGKLGSAKGCGQRRLLGGRWSFERLSAA